MILGIAAISAASAPALGQALVRDSIAPGVYLFRAPLALDKWTATNSVAIVNDEDVTVFDSNSRPATARMVIAEIRRITPKPVRTLINSHWHLDHWSGNDEYVKAFPGLRIVATTETRDYMKRMTGRFYADGIYAAVGRAKASLDTAIRAGKQRDGTSLTPDDRRAIEDDIVETAAFADEVATVPRVLPNVTFRDTLVMWSGRRELRLISVTGDATGSTVLYLPKEKILVMGDVLVRPASGDGPPPWATNSYAITPWLNSLSALATLDATTIVPGQGELLHGKGYLTLTTRLFKAIITQVHEILEEGFRPVSETVRLVNVDSIGRQYTPDDPATSPRFRALVELLVRKAHQEALDGVSKP